METEGFNGTLRFLLPFPTPQYFTKAMLLPAFAVAFIGRLPPGTGQGPVKVYIFSWGRASRQDEPLLVHGRIDHYL